MLERPAVCQLRTHSCTSVVRSFRISERANFQFRGEAFNALNKTNLGTPNRYVNEPQFGTITMPMTPGREIQLSARLSF